MTAHAEGYVQETRAQKVPARATGHAIKDERPLRPMCGG
jgi:hypothetical protein